MTALPFVIAHDAEIHIEKLLVAAQRNVKLLSMARVLGHALNCSWISPDGSSGSYLFEHVVLGWHRFEEISGDGGYKELQLVGFQVFAHRTTLEWLRDKRIVLDKGKGLGGDGMLAVETVAPNCGAASVD